MPKPQNPYTPRQPKCADLDANEGNAIDGASSFKSSVARQLRSLESVVNALHEKEVMALRREIHALYPEGKYTSENQQLLQQDWQREENVIACTPAMSPKALFQEDASPWSLPVCLDPDQTRKSRQPEVNPPPATRTSEQRSSQRSSQQGFATNTHCLYDVREDYKVENDDNFFVRHHVDFKAQQQIRKVVHTNCFEVSAAMVVLAYTVIMCIELQYNGMEIGSKIEAPGHSRVDSQLPRQGEDVFYVLGIIFNVLFCGELVCRLCAEGRHAVRSAWIWFDALIISLGMMDMCGIGLGFDPAMMRVARLLRLMRLLKLIQVFARFDSLFLLIKSIRASMGALAWSFLFLTAVQVVMGLLLCQSLQDFLDGGDQDLKSQQTVFKYFGTFTKTMLTMYEITFANWVPSCRVLMDEVHEAFALFYIFYRCLFCFAVLRVITAVFITETNRVLEHDDELTRMKRNRESRIMKKKLRCMFKKLDIDGDGTFDWHELDQFIKDSEVTSVVNTLGLDKYDLMKLFWLLDRGNGTVSVEEFLEKTGKLTGQSKAVDMQALLKLTHRIDQAVQRVLGTEEQDGPQGNPDEDEDAPEMKQASLRSFDALGQSLVGCATLNSKKSVDSQKTI